MATGDLFEVRLAAVEKEVAILRAAVLQPGSAPRAWYEPMVGSMRDLPEFEAVAQLGREIRLADVDAVRQDHL